MNAPSAALLIPCYQAAPFLRRLADDVAALRPPTFSEVLLYDDGSTDGTAALAGELGLRVLAGSPNRGAAHARNALARAASAEWLHFHDADDPLHADFLPRLAPLLTPDVDVAVGDADWLDERGAERLLAFRHPAGRWPDPLAENLRQGVQCNAMIVRRERFLAAGGFDESLRMWEDADLHVRLAAGGARYVGLGEVVTTSIRRAASFSHDYRANWNWRLRALENYERTLPHRVHAEIAAQAEHAARQLLGHGDAAAAARALALNHRLGGRAPETRHPALRLLRRVLPPLTLLRLQERLRAR